MEWYEDAIARILRLNGPNYLDTLENVLKELDVPCARTYRAGYSQGDWLDMLAVWTDEFGRTTGLTRDTEGLEKDADMNNQVYAAWAFGDVYGYTITDAGGDEIDSCWGYIETEWNGEKMGVTRDAKYAADRIANERKKEHEQQLKTWIRNKVPVLYRKATDPRLTNTQVIS